MINRASQTRCMQPPTWKCKIEKCYRSEVPTVPKDEVPKGEERSKVVVKSPDMHAEEMVVELDDWLIDFANLFRDQLGIDPDKCALEFPFKRPHPLSFLSAVPALCCAPDGAVMQFECRFQAERSVQNFVV